MRTSRWCAGVLALTTTLLFASASTSSPFSQPSIPILSDEARNGGSWDTVADAVIDIVHRHMPNPKHRQDSLKKHVEVMRLGEMERLVPNLLDDVDVVEFMARVAECGKTNDYLTAFLNDAVERSPAFFSDKDDLDEVVSDAIMYAVVLDRFTEAVTNDHTVLKEMVKIIDDVEATVMWRQYTNLFEKAKVETMNYCIKKALRIIVSHDLPSNSGRRTLPLNILEASVEDYRLGNDLNAKVALVLALQPPGQSEYDPATGAGPSIWHKSGEYPLYYPALPKLFMDLYSTWNAAFVSHYDNSPYFWAKLLNPQVGCYSDDPGVYIYKRSVALWLHVHWEVFGRVDRGTADPPMTWADQELTDLWQSVNLESSDHYLSKLDEVEEGWAATVRKHAKAVFVAMADTTASSLYELQQFLSDVSALAMADSLGVTAMVSLAWEYGSSLVEMIKALFWD